MSRAACDLEAGLKRLHLPTIRRMCVPIFEQAENFKKYQGA